MASDVRLAVVAVTIGVLATSCSSSSSASGHALDVLDVGGVSWVDAKPGQDWGFTFPTLTNNTAEPLTVVSVRVANVPAGVEILGYRAIPATRSKNLAMSSLGSGDEYDYRTYPNLLTTRGVVLRPHSSGDVLFAVDTHVVHPSHRLISGCSATYRLGSEILTQSFTCAWAVGNPFHDS